MNTLEAMSNTLERVGSSLVAGVIGDDVIVLNAAVSLVSLRLPPGNMLEALKGERRGQHSLRINDRFRLCFVWTADGPAEVEIVDYH
jgi:plasmid maintenance system killer protein